MSAPKWVSERVIVTTPKTTNTLREAYALALRLTLGTLKFKLSSARLWRWVAYITVPVLIVIDPYHAGHGLVLSLMVAIGTMVYRLNLKRKMRAHKRRTNPRFQLTITL